MGPSSQTYSLGRCYLLLRDEAWTAAHRPSGGNSLRGLLSGTYRVELIPCGLSQFYMLSRLAGEGTTGNGHVRLLESRSRIMEKEKVSLEKNPESYLIYYGLT